MSDVPRLARILGVEEVRVRSALASAIRRSEPDAREVYGLIEGRRFVARRAGQQADWKLSLERRPQLWERAAGVVPGRMAAVEHLCPQDCEARPAMGLAVRFDGYHWQLADLDDPVRTTKITACPFCGAHLPELSRRVHEP